MCICWLFNLYRLILSLFFPQNGVSVQLVANRGFRDGDMGDTESRPWVFEHHICKCEHFPEIHPGRLTAGTYSYHPFRSEHDLPNLHELRFIFESSGVYRTCWECLTGRCRGGGRCQGRGGEADEVEILPGGQLHVPVLNGVIIPL